MTKTKQTRMVVQKFHGSKGWLIFWIIVFWPIAIWYYFDKRKPTEVNIKIEQE